MCGIIGILSRNKSPHRDLTPALRMLKHRGPDDYGIFYDKHIHMGHTRLAILDLSSLGHQPMSYHGGRYVITFNGEIYNYLELREVLEGLGHVFISRSDTEVLLGAYAQWGKDCLKKLRGMFAFAIWDTLERRLFLARDRVGEKPLYYFFCDHTFYFASELKTLISILPFKPELNANAVDLFFHYQYVPEPATPLNNIYKVHASHYLLVDYDTWQVTNMRYWGLDQIEPIEGDPASLIFEELNRSIELTLRSDVPVGIALSGGLDSAAIAAIAAPKYKDSMHTFSVGYPGHPPYDERGYAFELADHLNLPFHDIELHTEDLTSFFPELVGLMDDPIADIAAFGHYSVMKVASDHSLKVILTGIGGDELFWGYAWVSQAVLLTERKKHYFMKHSVPYGVSIIERMASLPLCFILAHNKRVPGVIQAIFKYIFTLGKMGLSKPNQAVYQNLVPDFDEALRHAPRLYHPDFAARIQPRNPYTLFDNNDKLPEDTATYICQLLFDSWLASNCLSLGDRVSMASSVESRMPLLDYKLIELVFGLRKAYPDHMLPEKFLFKSALNGVIPNKILQRQKRGFQPPVREWMCAIINSYMHWLTDSILAEANVTSRNYVHLLIQDFKTKGRNIFMLYKLLLLETWYRKVILGEC